MKSIFILLLILIISNYSFSLNSYFNDQAGLFSYGERLRVEEILENLEQKTGVEFAVFILDSLKGIDIDTKTQELFDKYKPGKKKDDNGLMMVVAIKDKKVKVEPGYGLEGELNDAKIGRILDDNFVIYAKKGEIKTAVIKTLSAIISIVSNGEYSNSGNRERNIKKESPVTAFLHILFVLILIVIFIKNPSILFWILMFSGNGGSGSSFGSGGGFGGFGGGSSGGGGASRGW